MFDTEILPNIEGERVRLRWLTTNDVNSLFSIFSDPKVMRYWSSLPLADVAAAEKLLAEIHSYFEKRNLFQWGVARQTDNRIIGTCTLFHLDPDNRRAEIGYALGSENWGKGYMGDALKLLLNFCFDNLNLHRLEADVDPQNTASIKVLERLGFQREGYLRERWLVGGNVQDSLFYGLLKNEWQQHSYEGADKTSS